MTTDQVEKVPLNYCPEGYAAHLNSLLGWPWPEGSTQETVRAAEHEIMRALIRVADAYAAGDTARYGVLVAQLLPRVPDGLAPALYFEALAAQMALPIWERYSDEQQVRGHRYAARYVSTRLTRWLAPKHWHGVGPAPAEEEEPWSWKDLPRAASRAHMDAVAGKFQMRQWLTQVQAYLDTHPGGEADPAELREIMARWEDYQAEQAFF